VIKRGRTVEGHRGTIQKRKRIRSEGLEKRDPLAVTKKRDLAKEPGRDLTSSEGTQSSGDKKVSKEYPRLEKKRTPRRRPSRSGGVGYLKGGGGGGGGKRVLERWGGHGIG